jgi:hypothetical protein
VGRLKSLVIGLAFVIVLIAQGFTLAAFLNGKVMAESVAMIAWADAQIAVVLLACGLLATLILMVAMFRRRRSSSP